MHALLECSQGHGTLRVQACRAVLRIACPQLTALFLRPPRGQDMLGFRQPVTVASLGAVDFRRATFVLTSNTGHTLLRKQTAASLLIHGEARTECRQCSGCR